MTTADPITAYVPHRGAMLLLNRLIELSDEHAVAEGVVPLDGLFVRNARMPAWVGVEYMAQTIAAWSGARARQEGQAPRVGYLLGCRSYVAHCAGFASGAVLRVEARRHFAGDNGMGLFDCRILLAGREAATGRVSVFEPADGANDLHSHSPHA